jgi:hypothetical protein
MTREQFYRDEMCCEVARVYCRNHPELKQSGWAVAFNGKPHDPPLSKRQCDYFIDEICGGDIKEAEQTAMDYMSGGCGVAG